VAAAAEITIQHLGGLAELRPGGVLDRAAEVRVLEKVVEDASGLKRNAFGEAELTAERDVPLSSSKAAQGIESWIALRKPLP
jgi:hypothetical protein